MRKSMIGKALPRCGKTRFLTPKIPKLEDKEKKPTGRAHKRQQYNRRFVNADFVSGKKKSPNSSHVKP